MNKLNEQIKTIIWNYVGDVHNARPDGYDVFTGQAIAAIKQAVIYSLPKYKGSEPNIAGSLLEEGYNQAIEDIKKLLQ